MWSLSPSQTVAGVALGLLGAALRIYQMKTSAIGDDTPVRREKWTKNFWAQEFASRGREFAPGSREQYRALAGVLQQVRDYVSRPVVGTNGERKLDHNRAVGGAENSRHLPPSDRPDSGERDGVGVDIKIPGFTADQTYRLWSWIRDHADELGIGGTDFYPKGNFIHVDTRSGPVVTWGDKSGRNAWELNR